MISFNLAEQPTRLVTSEYYGQYVVRRIGRINVLKAINVDEYLDWWRKYHPRTYFQYINLNPEDIKKTTSPEHLVAWDVYLPIDTDNVTWLPVDTKYAAVCAEMSEKPSRKLPIAFTEKDVMKWRRKSEVVLEI